MNEWFAFLSEDKLLVSDSARFWKQEKQALIVWHRNQIPVGESNMKSKFNAHTVG